MAVEVRVNSEADLAVSSSYILAILDLEYLRLVQKIDNNTIRQEVIFMFELQKLFPTFILLRPDHRDC